MLVTFDTRAAQQAVEGCRPHVIAIRTPLAVARDGLPWARSSPPDTLRFP
jgi:hypothetical protein